MTKIEVRQPRVHDAYGDAHTDLWLPTGAIAETFPRRPGAANLSNLDALASARIHWFGITIPAGKTVTSITFVSATRAGATLTHTWFSLARQSDRVVLGSSADDTSAAWAANTVKTLNLSTPYVNGAADLACYLGLLCVGGTMPTFAGQSLGSNAGLQAITPVTNGVGQTGLTTPASLTSPATVTGSIYMAYAYVS